MSVETGTLGKLDGDQLLGKEDKTTEIVPDDRVAAHVEGVILSKLNEWKVPPSSNSNGWKMAAFTTKEGSVWTTSTQRDTEGGNTLLLEEKQKNGDVRSLTVEPPGEGDSARGVTYSEKLGENTKVTYGTNTKGDFDGARALSEGFSRLNGDVILVKNLLTREIYQQVWPPNPNAPKTVSMEESMQQLIDEIRKTSKIGDRPLAYSEAYRIKEAQLLNGPTTIFNAPIKPTRPNRKVA